MIEEERQPAPIGHNQPASPVDGLVAAQREALEPFRERLAYILDRAKAKDVKDRITAGEAGDILLVAKEFLERVDDDARGRRKPYRDASDAAKAVVDEFEQPLLAELDALRARLDAWQREEDERIAAQQREQDAFFAGKNPAGDNLVVKAGSPAPDLKPARRRKITGDLGARVSAVDVKHYAVVDVRAVPDIILNSKTVHDAIIQVARSMAKHMPKIDGIEITTSVASQVR